jgi:hypothetical protein
MTIWNPGDDARANLSDYEYTTQLLDKDDTEAIRLMPFRSPIYRPIANRCPLSVKIWSATWLPLKRMKLKRHPI